jgi:hypothetical protein
MQPLLKDDFLPIPIRVRPLPWEDIASLLSRVAEQMGYTNPQWVLSPEQYEHMVSARSVLTLHRAVDYRFLARLLLVDEEVLYACTLHRFATKLLEGKATSMRETEDIERPLLNKRRGIMGQFFHNLNTAKVCPQCLSEDQAYGRLYWQVRAVVACLRHNTMLQNTCSYCNSSIPLLRPSLVHCPYCKGDYRATHSVPICGDTYFLSGQKLILSQLGVEHVLQEESLSKLAHSPLFDILPNHYFRLLDAFRNILLPLFPDSSLLQVSPSLRPFLRRLSPQSRTWTHIEWAVFISTFHFIFASWPVNFYIFLDALSLVKGERRVGTGVQHDFGVFYDKWLYHRLPDPAYSFIREGFESYLRKNYSGGNVSRRLRPFRDMTIEPADDRPYLTLQQASRILGIKKENVDVLIAQGKILVEKISTDKTGKRYHCLVLRKSVEGVCEELKTLLPLQVVAKGLLGISWVRVLMLADAGLLVPVRGPKIDGSALWMYRAEDVEEFITRIVNCANPGFLTDEESLPLCKAFRFLGSGVTIVHILTEVLNGRLKPVDMGGSNPLLLRLKLSHQEIGRFLQVFHT